jgi:hydrogenase maturation factor
MPIEIERAKPVVNPPIRQVFINCEVCEKDHLRIFTSGKNVLFAAHKDGKEAVAVLVKKEGLADLIDALVELQNQDYDDQVDEY